MAGSHGSPLYRTPRNLHDLQSTYEKIIGIMWKFLLMATLLLLPQQPASPKPSELGIIAGKVVAPEKTTLKPPIQIFLMPPPYAAQWNQKLQEQLDLYWERYKPAFLQKKELFFEVSKMAYQDTLQVILARMSRDLGPALKNYEANSTPDGRFQFKNLPLGDYRVVAYGRAGEQTYYWMGSVNLTDSIPQFVQLKQHVP
jgi:hypothetical protein